MQTAVWSRARAAQVRCEASGVLVPKDKAVKRFVVRPRFAHDAHTASAAPRSCSSSCQPFLVHVLARVESGHPL